MKTGATTAEGGANTVAAIDIGSNSLRLAVAQILPRGQIEILEQLRQGARLGQDTFRRGQLSAPTMRAAVAILRDFRRVLDFYKVQHVRAVATSAVREAGNADAFVDRTFMATGLDIEMINTSEESRLTVSAVRRELGDALAKKRSRVLIADVGGGSTLLTVLEKGEIVASQSLRLGSIRLQEAQATTDEPPDRAAEILRHQIANVVAAVQGSLPLKPIQTFVAVGGDARFVASQVGKPTQLPNVYTLLRDEFDEFVRRCESHGTEDLAKLYGIPFADAETLNPALLVYQALLQATRAREIIVSHVTMRDGLLLDLARRVTGQEDETLTESVVHSALTVAEKYRVDLDHARTVADLSGRLFDELRPEHGLTSRYRLILRVAALLHEVGGFVSSRAHHKHSYYLILNSEVFGLNPDEVMIAAHTARYHRRSPPKPSHVEYMALPRDRRMVISKLAAILRVADGLDRVHAHQVTDFHCDRRGEEFIIDVPAVSDLTLERRALVTKADLFEDIYGMKVRLEEGRPSEMPQRRAQPVE